jgi:TonB family protein
MRLASVILLLLMINPKLAGDMAGTACVIHLESPTYSNVARFAKLQGEVVVRVEISPDGRVTSARALGGTSLLGQEAERNALTWVFATGGKRDIEVHYVFRLEKPEMEHNPPTRVTFDLPGRVIVISNFAPTEQ